MSGTAGDAIAAGSLVARAATGDRIAFARLVDAYYADTMRLAFVVTGGDREVAEDGSLWFGWRLGIGRIPAGS